MKIIIKGDASTEFPIEVAEILNKMAVELIDKGFVKHEDICITSFIFKGEYNSIKIG